MFPRLNIPTRPHLLYSVSASKSCIAITSPNKSDPVVQELRLALVASQKQLTSAEASKASILMMLDNSFLLVNGSENVAQQSEVGHQRRIIQ